MKFESVKFSNFEALTSSQMTKVLGDGETKSDGHGWVRCTDDGKMYGDGPGCIPMVADIITTDLRGNITCVECQTSDGVWH